MSRKPGSTGMVSSAMFDWRTVLDAFSVSKCVRGRRSRWLTRTKSQTLINVGIDEGARLLAGGPGKPDGFDTGWFVKPTVFADVTNDMRIAREEIFGPVLVVIPFDDEAEAIAIANDTPYGLAAFLQTGDPERAERVAAQLKAGAVHINGGGFGYGSPFGGYKQSGNGREGGIMGLEDYQEVKTLHFG